MFAFNKEAFNSSGNKISCLRHNPYVGFLHNKQYGGCSPWKESIIEEAKNSGIVGMIRHSPASSASGPTSMRNGLGLKGIIYKSHVTKGPIFSQLQMSRDLPSKMFSRQEFMSSLRKIPSSIYSSALSSSEEDISTQVQSSLNVANDPVCSICLETYLNGDELLTLACHHCFHSSCISKWFYKDFLAALDPSGSFRCPQCRQDHIALSERASSCCSESVLLDQGAVIARSSFVRVGRNIFHEVGYDMLSDMFSDDRSSHISTEHSPHQEAMLNLENSSYSDCGVPLKK